MAPPSGPRPSAEPRRRRGGPDGVPVPADPLIDLIRWNPRRAHLMRGWEFHTRHGGVSAAEEGSFLGSACPPLPWVRRPTLEICRKLARWGPLDMPHSEVLEEPKRTYLLVGTWRQVNLRSLLGCGGAIVQRRLALSISSPI